MMHETHQLIHWAHVSQIMFFNGYDYLYGYCIANRIATSLYTFRA